jgi:hypothetical protein
MTNTKTGVELIAEERQEQITKHNRTLDYDRDVNDEMQLGIAASALCLDDWGCNDVDDIIEDWCPNKWDPALWEKMMNKPYKERLIIAGALIAAEIDRLNQSSNGTE